MNKLGAIIAVAVCVLVLLNISTVFAFLFLLLKIALVVGLLALAGFLVFGFIEKPETRLPPAPTPKGEAPTEPVFEKPYFDAHEKGREGEEKVSAILQHMGWPALHNVILEDDRGLTEIDHLVKAPWGIVVIETKNYDGFISGSSTPGVWKQSFPNSSGVSYRLFMDPVHQNYRHVRAVKYLTEMENVQSVVVFAGRAYASPFVHHQVVRLKNLERVLRKRPESFAHVDKRELEKAWYILQQAYIANAGRAREHIDELRQRFS
ncbi:nuclease-related domain-containing protein [Acetobacter ascendens]|uniref:nuclease-related domain-containing protein n=1 Tax=Acetobacter ascendens TaxID=481146 RepID=UPI000875CDBF|nr:nuclease-related domain-containing protein [Acetobacter ascendens]AOW48087.1 DNA topoisomerase I [Acetobacter ascendens]